MLTRIAVTRRSSTCARLAKGHSESSWIGRRRSPWRRMLLFVDVGEGADHAKAKRTVGQIRKTMLVTWVSTRGEGAVGNYHRRSSELKPKTVALSRLSCRRSGARAGEIVVMGGAQGELENSHVNQEQRGGRGWPESPLRFVRAARSWRGILVA